MKATIYLTRDPKTGALIRADTPGKERLGLLGGVGARASALIYQRAMDYVVGAQSDADFPDLLIYSKPFKHSSVSCTDQIDELKQELHEALDRLVSAGCTKIWIACNSLHLYDLTKYPVVNLPRLIMAENKEFFAKKPIILGSEATVKAGLYNGCDYNEQGLINEMINQVITSPASWISRQALMHVLSTMRAKNVLLACTELSVLFWSMPENERMQFPNVLDTSDFIAKKIANYKELPWLKKD